MFVSTYEVNVDSKGRVSVPPSFRAALGGKTRILLWPAIDGAGCLEGGGEELFRTYQETIMRLTIQKKKRRALVNAFASKAFDLKMDDPGRIKLPEDWMANAGIGDTVLFVGAMDSFQIWEPEAYAAFDAEMSELAQEDDTLDALDAPYGEVMAAGGVSGLRVIDGGED
ncbi:MAG: division/cell wall cluster transcriptional repressor MraZ [Pseudomonadota bacterium]